MPINYKLYPPNWASMIVPAVLLRANNCCEECGLENYSTVYSIKLCIKDNGRYKLRSIWFRDERDAKRECTIGEVKKVKVVLTVSHMDHDEFNHKIMIERLRALCQMCHLRYDAAEKWKRQLRKWKDKNEI